MPVRGRFLSPFAAFAAQAAASPAAPFLIAPASAGLPYARQGLRISYGEFFPAIEALRAEYARQGYGRGARVALLLENRPEFFLHWLALNALGVSIVPINPDLRPEELAWQLRVSGAALLVTLAQHLTRAREATPDQTRVIEAGDAIPPCQTEGPVQADERNSECALLFTSGSSGKPKGCMLSNDYFLRIAEWYASQGGVAELGAGTEINLTPLPMFHMNALACSAVGMMVIGGAVVPLDRFHARNWWQSVAESQATVIHCLGVIPAILLKLPPCAEEARHSVRFAFAPGVEFGHRLRFEERYRIPIVDAWAMTETGGAACTTTAREKRGFGPGCIGRPSAGMEWRIVDAAGLDAEAGTAGELLVRARGPDPRSGFFSGYLDDPAATAEAWRGGWFHTGDYIRAGPDGLLYFFDRKKSIVRRSGENIAVLEVESALQRLPPVESAAVTPVADELRGEEVFAFVVRSAATTEADADLARGIVIDCSKQLAYYKLPGYIAFVDELPLNATRKLARGEIRQLAASALAEGKAFDLRALKGALRKGLPDAAVP